MATYCEFNEVLTIRPEFSYTDILPTEPTSCPISPQNVSLWDTFHIKVKMQCILLTLHVSDVFICS